MNNSIIILGNPVNYNHGTNTLAEAFPNICRINNHFLKGGKTTLWATSTYFARKTRRFDRITVTENNQVEYTEKGKKPVSFGPAYKHLNIIHYPRKKKPTTGIILLSHIVYNLDYYPIFIMGWFKRNTLLGKSHSFAHDRMYIDYLIKERKVFEIE